jgi:hypothetical protein
VDRLDEFYDAFPSFVFDLLINIEDYEKERLAAIEKRYAIHRDSKFCRERWLAANLPWASLAGMDE